MASKVDGCLCDEIDPSDRPCLVCEATLLEWAQVDRDVVIVCALLGAQRRPSNERRTVHVVSDRAYDEQHW